MIYNYLLLFIILSAVGAFLIGRSRAIRLSTDQGGIRMLHSLPSHYGALTALAGVLPALLIYGLWLSIESSFLDTQIINEMPASILGEQGSKQSLILNDIKNTINGNITVSQNETIKEAANRYTAIQKRYRNFITGAVAVSIILLTFLTYRIIAPALRARNIVETVIKFGLDALFRGCHSDNPRNCTFCTF